MAAPKRLKDVIPISKIIATITKLGRRGEKRIAPTVAFLIENGIRLNRVTIML